MTVYRYSFWDENRTIQLISRRYATLEAIRDGLGVPIYAESRQVPAAEVFDGVWKPKPTVLE